MQQGEMLYEGKAKQVFLTDDPDMILIHYKDAATAFNNIKKATIENKGVLNNRISTLIFEYLNKQGIKTHYVKTLNDRDQLCRRVRIIPLEVIGPASGYRGGNEAFERDFRHLLQERRAGRSADQRSSCGGAGCRNL